MTKRIKTVTIFGTRPEAIKMAPLIQKLQSDVRFLNKVIVTAQHRSMLDQVMEKFNIHADYDLDIMQDGQTIADITNRVLARTGGILEEIKPDIVLVHGDTTTTFAAALSAFYGKVSVGHVEAGLRSFDKYQPYPEEINRKLVTGLADIHFAPTRLSKENLLLERVAEESIYVTGNTAVDAVRETIKQDYSFSEDTLNGVDYKGRKVIVMTAHRRENLGKPLEEICGAVDEITRKHADAFVVYAVHKNPAVRGTARALLGGNERVLLTESLDIDDMHNLIARSYIVLTDSGGLQEEAPALDKPVCVLRNVTERPEGIKAGTLIVAGCEKSGIVSAVSRLFEDSGLYEKMAKAKNPYGDGEASGRIRDSLLYHFGVTDVRPRDYEII